jgi:exodeoxyribonuclease VII small subunit
MGKSRGSVEKPAVAGDVPPDIQALPIEKCFEELEQIVESLEQQAVSLEQSIALFERGMALSRRCSSELNRMEKRIQLIMENDQGQPVYEDFPAGQLDDSVDE